MPDLDSRLMNRDTLEEGDEQRQAGGQLKAQREAMKRQKKQEEQERESQEQEAGTSLREQAQKQVRASRRRKKAQLKQKPWRQEAPFGLRIAIGIKETIDFLTLGLLSPITNFIMMIYIVILALTGSQSLRRYLKKRIVLPLILEFFPFLSALPWYFIFVFGAKLRVD